MEQQPTAVLCPDPGPGWIEIPFSWTGLTTPAGAAPFATSRPTRLLTPRLIGPLVLVSFHTARGWCGLLKLSASVVRTCVSLYYGRTSRV